MLGDFLVEHILTKDRTWAAYALADLQPEFAPHCRWFPVRDEGVVLLFDAFSPTVLFAMGEAEIVAEAILDVPLPERVSIHIREHHLPLLVHHYDFGDDLRPMLRLRLTDPNVATQRGSSIAVRLRDGDAPRICSLSAHGGEFTPDFFSDTQVAGGLVFGTEAAGELIAVGGTHILDVTRGIAAVGNMYTHPSHRGQGHATAILAALVQDFVRNRIQTVIMNVDQRNETARRLYERLGFAIYCSYWEGVGAFCQ